jgi:hypothetical protein
MLTSTHAGSPSSSQRLPRRWRAVSSHTSAIVSAPEPVLRRSALNDTRSSTETMQHRHPVDLPTPRHLAGHGGYASKRRSRRLFETTKTLENAIAAPAISGLSSPAAASGSAETL